MKRVVFVLLCSLVLGATLYDPAGGQNPPPAPAPGQGPINSGQRVWLVKYHKDQPNDRHGGIAVRLKTWLEGGRMLADLSIYRRLNGAGTHYERALPADIITRMEGTAPVGDGLDRKRLEFTLTKAGSPIVVKGFFHTARDHSSAGRADDVMVIRIIDTSKVVKTSDPPCDQSPPDEDVLSEDDPLDPPASP